MIYQRHPLDIGPLVFGLVFLGIVAGWGLYELGVVSRPDAAWILPIVLIGAGALGVVLALTKPRRTAARQTAAQEAAAQEAAAAHAGQWAPTTYTERSVGYAEAPAHDDTLEQTAVTETRTDETDTETDTDTDTDTRPGTGPTDTDAGSETETDRETRERHDG